MSQLTKIIFLIIGVAVFMIIIAVTKSPPGAIKTAVTEFFSETPLPTPTPIPTSTPLSAFITSPSGDFHTIEISDSGFTPSELIISSGNRVNFINKGTKQHWPASESHPVIREFQSCQEFELINSAIEPGQLQQLIFNEPKLCSLFDKLNPLLRGTLIVR